MKRTILLVYLFLFNSLMEVNAADPSVFLSSNITAGNGEEVTITISLDSKTRYQSIGIFVPLDSTKVEYISCGINGFSSASLKDCGLNPRNEVTFYALTISENDDRLFKENGDILDIRLRIKDNVHENIPINYEVSDFSKSSTEKLEFETISGVIAIDSDVESKDVDTAESLGEKVVDVSKDDKITWSSSNDEVAVVDDNGKVSFNESGNTTITAKDSHGKIVFEKTYLVNKKIKKSIAKFIIIGIAGVIILVLGTLFAMGKLNFRRIFSRKKKS